MRDKQDKLVAELERNTSDHVLHIVRDTGDYKHLVGKNIYDDAFRFEAITTPGMLVILGDIADGFIFEHENKKVAMLKWFRDTLKDGKEINPLVWGNLLVHRDKLLWEDGENNDFSTQYIYACCVIRWLVHSSHKDYSF